MITARQTFKFSHQIRRCRPNSSPVKFHAPTQILITSKNRNLKKLHLNLLTQYWLPQTKESFCTQSPRTTSYSLSRWWCSSREPTCPSPNKSIRAYWRKRLDSLWIDHKLKSRKPVTFGCVKTTTPRAPTTSSSNNQITPVELKEQAEPVRKLRRPDVAVKAKWVSILRNIHLLSKATTRMTLTPQTTSGREVLEFWVLSSIVSSMRRSSTLAASCKLRTTHTMMLRDWCPRQQVGLWSSQTLIPNPRGKQNSTKIANLSNRSQTRTSKLFNNNRPFQALKVLKMYHK